MAKKKAKYTGSPLDKTRKSKRSGYRFKTDDLLHSKSKAKQELGKKLYYRTPTASDYKDPSLASRIYYENRFDKTHSDDNLSVRLSDGGTVNKIVESDIVGGSKFKIKNGTVFIIDGIYDDKDFGTAVEISIEGKKKGGYVDSIGEVVDFFNEEEALKTLADGGAVEKKKGYWIKDAIKNSGALKRAALRMGLIHSKSEKLSRTDLHKLEREGGKTSKRAYLAETLGRFKDGGKLNTKEIAIGTWVKNKKKGNIGKVWDIHKSANQIKLDDQFGNRENKWFDIKDWKITKEPVEDKGHEYKLGDKYSSDFDYEGMFDMGLKSDVSWGVIKLKKLFNSFEDVNYDRVAMFLWEAIKNLEDENVEEAKENIESFHESIKEEMAVEYAYGGSVISYKEGGSLCEIGMDTQSLIFDKKYFTESAAKKWAKENNYISPIDEKENTYHLRQEEPSEFVNTSFRTIPVKRGIKMVIACPKRKKNK